MNTTNKQIKPTITVIICTHNRSYILKECLKSIKEQTVSNSLFHVIIVDNNSTDSTQEIAVDFCAQIPNASVIFEPTQGASYARNKGIAEAHSDWIAFLDDDAKAHSDWLATILDTISRDDFDAFGGPYYEWHLFGPAPQWLPPQFETYEAAQEYGPLEGHNYIPGGNCAFKLSVATSVGNFPKDIGMSGNKCAYGEETFLFNRMRDAGFRLGYVPDMQIDHCVLPYKYGFIWQIKSFYARGQAYQEITNNGAHGPKAFLGIGARLVFSSGKALALLGYGLICGWKPHHQQAVTIWVTRFVFRLGQLCAAIRQAFEKN